MKRLFSFLLICTLVCVSMYSQPKSIEYEKPYDFFLNVITNPQARLYDFLNLGLNSRNAYLHDFPVYERSKYVQEWCRNHKTNVRVVYGKIKASWQVLKEIEHTDLSVSGFGQYMLEYHRDNVTAPRNCPNPELKHKLSIVPLALERY